MTLPFIPIQAKGLPNKLGRVQTEEEWVISFNGRILEHPHPTFADKQSALVYVELLQQEVENGCFSFTG